MAVVGCASIEQYLNGYPVGGSQSPVSTAEFIDLWNYHNDGGTLQNAGSYPNSPLPMCSYACACSPDSSGNNFFDCYYNTADCDVYGCLDEDACNYNETPSYIDVNVDFNYELSMPYAGEPFCSYPTENGPINLVTPPGNQDYDCDGNCAVESDCFGICGGDAVIDECGICNGPGPTFVCWNGDLECSPNYCSFDYPWASCVEQNTDYCSYVPPLQNFGEPDCFDVPVSNSVITNTTNQGLGTQTITVCINNVDVGCMDTNSDTFSETVVVQCAKTCYDLDGNTNQAVCNSETDCSEPFPLCHDCCLYQGCTNGAADNYGIQTSNSTYIGSTLNQDCDDCCIISGCTDSGAINYDSNANTDDGSCIEENRKLLISPIHTFGYIYDTYSIQLIGEDNRENTTYLANCNNFDLSEYDNPLYCEGDTPVDTSDCFDDYQDCLAECGLDDHGCAGGCQTMFGICEQGGFFGGFFTNPDCFITGYGNSWGDWNDIVGTPCGTGGTCEWNTEIINDCPQNCQLGLEPNEEICASQMYQCNNDNPTCSEQECNFYFGVCYSSITGNHDQFSTNYCNYDSHCPDNDHCMSGYDLTFSSIYSSYVEGGVCASSDGMMDAIDSMSRVCSIEDCNITDENSYCYVESGITMTDDVEYQANRDVTCLNDPQSDILVSGEINSQIIVEQNLNKGGLYPTNGINVDYYTIEIYECSEGTNRENYLIECEAEGLYAYKTATTTQLINGGYTYKFEKAGLFKFNVYTNEYSTVDGVVTPIPGNNITGFIDVSDVIKINQSIPVSKNTHPNKKYRLTYHGIHLPNDDGTISPEIEWELTRNSLKENDRDKRPMLGMVAYNEENLTSFWTEEVGDKFSAAGEHFAKDNNSAESYRFTPDFDVRTLKAIQNSKAVLYKYYDPSIDPEQYNDNSAPAEVRFFFYPREHPAPGVSGPAHNPFFNRGIRIEYNPTEPSYNSEIEYYVADINWGDGNKEFETEPEKLDPYTYIGHHYEKSGIYEITGYMIRTTVTAGDRGVNGFQRFSGRIYLTEGTRGNDEFKSLGGDGFTFIPYKDTTPIIGGVSKNSMYYKSIARYLGYLTPESTEVELTIPFQYYSDRINIETALMTMDETRIGETISHFASSYALADSGFNITLAGVPEELNGHVQGETIWDGDEYLDTIGDLGNNLGQVDIGQVRYFNKPKPMWEMLGFDDLIDDYTPELGEELVINGDFSLGGNGDSNIVGWEQGHASYPNTATYSLQNPDGVLGTGDESLRIADGDGGDQRGKGVIWRKPNGFNYELGKTYRLTFDAKASHSTLSGWLRTDIHTSGTEFGSYNYTTEWQTYEFNFDLSMMDNDGATAIYSDKLIGLYCQNWGIEGTDYVSQGQWIEFDNVSVREVLNTESIEYDTTEEASSAYQSNHPGNPASERYWNNIIPADTDIIEDRINDIYNLQEWLDNYYYPVLPKINDRGKFSDELQGNRIPFGAKETWDGEDYDAYITQEIISDDSLIIDMNMQITNKLGDNVLEDNSGNQNIGITISDYKLNFDKNTYTPSAEDYIKDITIEDTEDLSY